TSPRRVAHGHLADEGSELLDAPQATLFEVAAAELVRGVHQGSDLAISAQDGAHQVVEVPLSGAEVHEVGQVHAQGAVGRRVHELPFRVLELTNAPSHTRRPHAWNRAADAHAVRALADEIRASYAPEQLDTGVREPTVVHLPDGFRTVTLPGEQVFEPYRSFRLIDAVALARSFVFTSRGTRTAGTRHGFRHAARSPGRGARRRRGVRGDELPERPTDRYHSARRTTRSNSAWSGT